ncbi:MAG: OmpA family protein [Proteobacteria bacterium]|nr:OmpA family protein [Pseudomonadota bacterium]
MARKLLANAQIHLRIEGHTSSNGSNGYNRRLSGSRAAAVRTYLINKGVAHNRLTSKGFGEDRLLVKPEKTEQDREVNRRVEFTITRGQQECPE